MQNDNDRLGLAISGITNAYASSSKTITEERELDTLVTLGSHDLDQFMHGLPP